MIWKNWAKNVEFTPKAFIKANSVEEIQEIVKKANQSKTKIRVSASGHSFSRVCETEDLLIDISKLTGVIDVDQEKKQMTFWAGTRIREVGEFCVQHNMAQENLGDYDCQTLAGAVSTGTHGSGKYLGNIPKQIVAFWIVTPNGELVECSAEKNADLFEAGRVSIGLLGVIVKVKLQLVETYKLKCESSKVNLLEILDDIPQLLEENRNLEFFYFPMTKYAQCKKMNITNEPIQDPAWKNYIHQTVIENYVLKALCSATSSLKLNAKKINQLMAKFVDNDTRVNVYNKVLATERSVRFLEMELSIPAEHFKEFFLKVYEQIEQKQYNVFFPIEIRWVNEDSIWLSHAYGRNSVYFAFHTYIDSPLPEYFEDMKELAKQYQARPHWGKINLYKGDYLKTVYPKWNHFMNIRKQIDPNNIFVNPHMKDVIGES